MAHTQMDEHGWLLATSLRDLRISAQGFAAVGGFLLGDNSCLAGAAIRMTQSGERPKSFTSVAPPHVFL